jgi:WD40 repeat protein
VVALSGGAPTRLTESDSSAAIVAGHLLFIRRGTLYGLRFDEKRLTTDGEAFPVAESVTNILSKGAFTASATGTVAYRAGGRLKEQLVWLDRSGKTVRSILPPDEGGLFNPVVGADGRVLFQRSLDGNFDLWLSDGARGGLTRMASDPAIEWCPVWSSDGQRIVFGSNRLGTYDLYQRPVAGPDEILLKLPGRNMPTDWSRDGQYILYRVMQGTRSDLWVLPVGSGQAPFPFLQTQFDEREGQFSPDGHWIAYQSDESGWYQIYLKPFPGPGESIPVTVDGGTQPRWRRDGRELFYLSPDEKLVAVPIALNGNGPPRLASPVALFQTQISGGPVPGANRQQYDVSPDGQQFLMSVSVADAVVPPISMILNWKPAASRSSTR